MKIIGILAIIVAIYIWWTNKRNRVARGTAVIVCIIGIWAFNSSFNTQQKQAAQERRDSSSLKAESKKEDSSISEDEKVSKLKVKNTCNALNEEMSQHQELQGFKIKPSSGAGDQFVAEVPDAVTSMSDNEQENVYRSLVKLIYSYDNGTNEGTLVEFENSNGAPVARSTYTGDGNIKLEK